MINILKILIHVVCKICTIFLTICKFDAIYRFPKYKMQKNHNYILFK